MTSRRTFLRVLTAAAIGAVVAPHIPLSASVVESGPPPWWRSQATLGMSPPLTLDMLRDAFNQCSRGGGHAPTYLITTRAVAESYARMCGLVYDMDVAA